MSPVQERLVEDMLYALHDLEDYDDKADPAEIANFRQLVKEWKELGVKPAFTNFLEKL